MSRSYSTHDRRRKPSEERRQAQVSARLARIIAQERAASPLAGNAR